MLVYILGIPVLLFFLWLLKSFKRKKDVKGKHVLISGGSSGIGLCAAIDAVQRGAKVTLFARDEKKLNAAKEKIMKMSFGEGIIPEVQIYSIDISGSKQSMAEVVTSAERKCGPIYMLINCAGFAKPAKFEDLTAEEVEKTVRVNFLGSFYLSQLVVKNMKKEGDGGMVVFVSSQGGLVGIFGYTAYASSKAALIKLAEALHSEVKPYNISVTVHCPPDTDTPGFDEENKTKPVETELISETGGLYKPEEVASLLMNDSLQGKFLSSPGVVGFLLTTLCAGVAPVDDLFTLMCQILFTPLFRFISIFLLWNNDQIIKKEFQKRENSKKLN